MDEWDGEREGGVKGGREGEMVGGMESGKEEERREGKRVGRREGGSYNIVGILSHHSLQNKGPSSTSKQPSSQASEKCHCHEEAHVIRVSTVSDSPLHHLLLLLIPGQVNYVTYWFSISWVTVVFREEVSENLDGSLSHWTCFIQ